MVKAGEEITVANKLRVLAPEVIETKLKEKNKFGQLLTDAEFLDLFSYQDLYHVFLKGGLENWSPTTFIEIMPKESRFENMIDAIENFNPFYSKWMTAARAYMKHISLDKQIQLLSVTGMTRKLVICFRWDQLIVEI